MTHRLVCFRFPSCILPKQNENLSFITVHYEQESRKYQRELKQYLDFKKKEEEDENEITFTALYLIACLLQ